MAITTYSQLYALSTGAAVPRTARRRFRTGRQGIEFGASNTACCSVNMIRTCMRTRRSRAVKDLPLVQRGREGMGMRSEGKKEKVVDRSAKMTSQSNGSPYSPSEPLTRAWRRPPRGQQVCNNTCNQHNSRRRGNLPSDQSAPHLVPPPSPDESPSTSPIAKPPHRDLTSQEPCLPSPAVRPRPPAQVPPYCTRGRPPPAPKPCT